MTSRSKVLTAAQVILLAADDLHGSGVKEFSEWQLTVAAWKRDANRFGLRGFESDHPDHKRVMMEIMGQTKKDNPIRRQFMRKTRPNHYLLTDLGRSEAALLRRAGSDEEVSRSAAPLYDTIEPLLAHSGFQQWRSDPDQPKSWVSVSSFLGLRGQSSAELNDRIRAILRAVEQAEAWCKDHNLRQLTRGPSGGGSGPKPLEEIRLLREFLSVLEERFARQLTAIRSRA